MSNLITLQQAAERLGVSYRRVYELAQKRRINGLVVLQAGSRERFLIDLGDTGELVIEPSAREFTKIKGADA